MLTTAVGLQRDITGQRELHEGCYYTGVEPPGLSQQALGCVWELEARVDPIWKDLQGVFTSGLMTGREAEQAAMDTVRGHTAWQGVPAGWPGSARPQALFCSCCFPCLDHLPSSTGSCLSFNSAWSSPFQETSLMWWAGLGGLSKGSWKASWRRCHLGEGLKEE